MRLDHVTRVAAPVKPGVGDGVQTRFIQTELEFGLTSVTVALLAYHLGEPARGDAALNRATEAHAEAKRALAQVSGENSHSASAQAKELSNLLKEIAIERPVFGPDLWQPSMS